jgi:hypothetical protein
MPDMTVGFIFGMTVFYYTSLRNTQDKKGGNSY